MPAVEDSNKSRQASTTTFGKGTMYNQYPTAGMHPKTQGHVYLPHADAFLSHSQNDNDMAGLPQGFSGLGIHAAYGASLKPNQQLQPRASDYGAVPVTAGLPQAYMYNGQIIFASQALPNTHGPGLAPSPGMYNAAGQQFINPATFQGYPPHMISHSPVSQSWANSRVSSAEMPTLITPRRDSTSSNENDVPGTPFTQFAGYGSFHPSVAVIDRSPNSFYAWSTPSPPQSANSFSKVPQMQSSPISAAIQLLLAQAPAIPRAVPAPYSPMKPLDRSLENPYGVTNVYLRGLLPETTDDFLYKLASRFGEIVSSKSIIDHNTGLCKGYGFVKYHNFKDAENCIRGFHHLGYETSFARESFYSQLKKLQDDGNTNLYVSNLPKEMNEHELGAIFGPHKVCSSRILRDSNGNGRGVGFARFETREVCDDIIRKFNNTPVFSKRGGDEHLIQLRFADTSEQKSLKQQTAAARQYRTAEYESQTQGRGSFFDSARMNVMPSLSTVPSLSSMHGGSQPTTNEFERFMASSVIAQNSPYARSRLNAIQGHFHQPSPPVVSLPSMQHGEDKENIAPSDVSAGEADHVTTV